MKRTKRWLLIFAALVCLMAHAGALRATSLIFGRGPATSATTTTTENPSPPVEEEEVTEASPSSGGNDTSTKPTLTGIPQIDYIWDPNLPRELNGYNLSDYPFYNSVPPPEEIDFKCDGLHDGFYASVKHKCQLYHHCLYGIRYDFLCANFTAFDQKTFICHFVSEVDCKNSPKYFHRNDALYKAATSSTTTTTTTPAPPSTADPPPSSDVDRIRPGRPHRRPPLRRRRPQVDYYYDDEDFDDDYYDDRITRRRKQRPRVRRPDYDDDYDDRRSYRDDERYEKRPYSYDYDYDHRKSERPRNRNRQGDSRRTNDDERLDRRNPPVDRRRPLDERRSGMGDRRYNNDDRRVINEDRRHPADQSKSQEADESVEERRISNGRRRFNGDRRPIYNDDNDRSSQRDQDEDIYNEKKEQKSEEKTFVRPSGSGSSSSLSSLFERPRAPPKISRPVPVNEKKKYEYTTKKTTTTPSTISDEEYYDEYEDVPSSTSSKEEKPSRVPEPLNFRENKKPLNTPIREDPRNRYETIRSTDSLEEIRDRPSQSSRYRPMMRDRTRFGPKSSEPSPDDDEIKSKTIQNDRFLSRNHSPSKVDTERTVTDYRQEKERESLQPKEFTKPRQPFQEEPENLKPSLIENDEKEEKSESSREEESIKEVRPIIRLVKRPFLPSRGGSPYLARGLQPVGAAQKPLETTTSRTTTTTSEQSTVDMESTISGVRFLEHGAPILRSGGSSSDIDYLSSHKGPRTTQKPQIDPPRSPLDDIFDNEYDVTLNDALNPTLKPLTSSKGPTGFSYIGKFDRDRYTYNGAPLNNDSTSSSTAVRGSAIQLSSSSSSSVSGPQSTHYSRGSHTYYDDYDY